MQPVSLQPNMQPRKSCFCVLLIFCGLEQNVNTSVRAVQTDYHGKTMHSSVREHLKTYFRRSNNALYNLLKRDFQWADVEQ